jgi:hypothetical protein
MKACFSRRKVRLCSESLVTVQCVHARKGTHTVSDFDVETRKTYCKMYLTETCSSILQRWFATFFASINSTYVQWVATAMPAEMHIRLRVTFQSFLAKFIIFPNIKLPENPFGV